MRICIDLTSLADHLSGIERYALNIALSIINREDAEFVLLFKGEVHPLFADYETRNNVVIEVLPTANKLVFNQLLLPWKIHKIKADWYLFLAFPAPLFLFKKHMISTIHDIGCWDCPQTMTWWSNIYFRISHLAALRKCEAIITISEYTRDRICSRFKYPRDKVWIIYCGINKQLFYINADRKEYIQKKYNIPEPYILSLGTLEPRKNLPLLIQAYDRCINAGHDMPKLVLAGRKGWKMDCFFQSMTETVKENVLFTGFVEDKDLAALYANARFFVFPSMYEGFGLPPLEAMACGTPVLAADNTSMPEILGDDAVYFESNDLLSFENAMEYINKNAETKRKDIIEHQRYRFFDWDKEALKLWQILKKATNS